MLKTKLTYRYNGFKHSARDNQRVFLLTEKQFEELLEAEECKSCASSRSKINNELRMKYGERADERYMYPFMIDPNKGWVAKNVVPLCKTCIEKPADAHHSVGGSALLPGASPHAPSGLDLPALRAEILEIMEDPSDVYPRHYIVSHLRDKKMWNNDYEKALKSLINDNIIRPTTPNGTDYVLVQHDS